MKDYYHILGVHESSSEAEIKSRFRELAMRYHPDQNDDPASHRRFVEINQAYETLIDPQKRVLYKYKYQRWKQRQKPKSRPTAPSDTPPPSYEAWEPAYTPSPRTSETYRNSYAATPTPPVVLHPAFTYTARAARFLSFFTFLIAVLIIIDRGIDERIPNQLIQSIDFREPSTTSSVLVLEVTTPRFIFPLSVSRAECLAIGDDIALTRTRILGIVKQVDASIPCKFGHQFMPYPGIHGGPFALVIILLVLSVLPWFTQKHHMPSTFIGILLIFGGIITLGILINS